MYALVDINGFYAAAEAVFDLSLRRRPVIVLTNNDGCVCAMNSRAKALNIPRFAPYFKVKELCQRHQVAVRSSNYELYADLSARFSQTLAQFCSNMHVYSIDEVFLDLSGMTSLWPNQAQLGHAIRRCIWTQLRLPVSVGIANTLTLAKAANHAAKKVAGYQGVCVLHSEQQRQAILGQMKLDDVWGIGRRLAKKLPLLHINNALDLASMKPEFAKAQVNIELARTVRELNGEAVKSWDHVRANKQQIFSTRSFGERVTDSTSLNQALVQHGAIAAKKARQQGSLCHYMMAFAANSPFDANPMSFKVFHRFSQGTNDSTTIANALTAQLGALFKPNVAYYRVGVGLLELVDEQQQQLDLFCTEPSHPALMRCMDQINQRFGQVMQLAGEGISKPWAMRRAFLSPHYTTRWSDVPKIRC
ncbi:Y-family DNA polymerase [Motilimonas eburnea]|uniref:Y-family DNA polymerase n=1 Tax=Motilimonas eburnea TaxID=1737488 RepID=UPI001E598633|nr:Y-family DNA polymerase [Motilimonas eburnea]MCE2570452.1 Y-family DNA polymerase [Motilimonas eburnea]